MSDEPQEESGQGDKRETMPHLSGEEVRKLFELYRQADDEGREQLHVLFALAGLPPPVSLPRPPEEVTPEMGIAALQNLVRQSQALARESARVMLGIQRIDVLLGHRMLIDAHLAQGHYQEILHAIIADLEQRK